jgi:DNA-binding MarR family transcriptional regulator
MLSRRLVIPPDESISNSISALGLSSCAGLIERHPDPGDRRGRLVRLTAAGERLLDRAVGIRAANESRLLGPLDDDELQALDGCLRKLLAALDGAQAG